MNFMTDFLQNAEFNHFRIPSLFYLFYIHEGYRIPLRYVIRKQKN